MNLLKKIYKDYSDIIAFKNIEDENLYISNIWGYNF